MNGLEQVKTALAGALKNAGIAAHTAYSPGWAKSYHEPVVAIGLRTGESRGGAMGSYMGQRVNPDTLDCQEVYGMRLELVLSLDIYCPPGEGAGRCDYVLEALHQVMLNGLPSGLRPIELKWEETVWDGDTSMFLRRGSLACGAFFVAETSEEQLELADFILKGVLTK
ncbi:MAG: hypothetical protein HFF69_06745 [Oscillospiraceae bacterium]|nr:hypothetical protein [Oscillospiraceae bacterium]